MHRPVPRAVPAGAGPAVTAFDAATAVHAVTDPAAPDRPATTSFEATLPQAWAIGDNPHGGYLLAVIARAAADAVRAVRIHDDHPHPLSTSAVFLRPPAFGAARIDVELLRTGRSVTHVQATLTQDGAPCVRALHVFGRIDPRAKPSYTGEDPPAQAGWDQSAPPPRPAPGPDGTRLRVGITDFVDMRFDPATLSEAGGGRPAELRAWIGFVDGRGHDPLSLLLAADALPPVTFTLGMAGWVPTFELTAYVRALPAPGPLQVRQRGRLLQDGRLDEVCDVWDSTGRLVTQATQLAGVRSAR